MKINQPSKRGTSFRLTPEALSLLPQLAGKLGLSKSGLLEILIRDHAKREGVRTELGSLAQEDQQDNLSPDDC